MVMDYYHFFLLSDESIESRDYFEKANELYDKIAKFLIIYTPNLIGFNMIFMSASSVLYCYITRGYVQVDYLYSPYKVA